MLIFAGIAHSGLASSTTGYWAAILALMTAYVGTLGQAVGVQREFSGVMAKPWRMVALHAGVWAEVARQLGWLHIPAGPLTILDYTCLLIVAGCVQTIVIRLRRILAALEAQTRRSTPMRTSRACIEEKLTSWDGAELVVPGVAPRSRPGRTAERAKRLILFHRGHEHGGRWQHVVDALALDDVAVFAWDARGHGRSSGERGAADSVAALVKDADALRLATSGPEHGDPHGGHRSSSPTASAP